MISSRQPVIVACVLWFDASEAAACEADVAHRIACTKTDINKQKVTFSPYTFSSLVNNNNQNSDLRHDELIAQSRGSIRH